MFLYPDNPQSCITLSPIVLDELKRMSAGQLKVYIYIGACYKGQPISASIRQFKSATGLGQRSVIAALKALREKKLITCISGRGNQPNQYGIPLPRRQDTAAPPTIDTLPNPGLRQARSPVATLARATMPEHITALPSPKSVRPTATTTTPTPATIQELIATCYRPIRAQEFVEIKQEYSDEVVLREKLEQFKLNGDSVGPGIEVGFFIQALRQFA
jgi:hypothetical protein